MIGSMMAAGLGAGISTAGRLYANEQNIDYNKWKNNVDWAIAQQNNATQIDMANTAHQREVKDLRAAGLNPILSAGGNGSPTPSLTSPEMSTPQVENPVSDFAPSARQVAQMMSDSTAADIAQKMATTSNLEAQNKNIEAQNTLIRAQAEEVMHRTGRDDARFTYGFGGTELNGNVRNFRRLLEKGLHNLGNAWDARWNDARSFSSRQIERVEKAVNELKSRWDNWQPNIHIDQHFPPPSSIRPEF